MPAVPGNIVFLTWDRRLETIKIKTMKLENCNVLITGGASGIGKLMGRIALEKGAACLIIWDINPVNIERTKAELGKLGKEDMLQTYQIMMLS